MKVLVVRPMEMPEVQEIDHTLSAMQELVGGTIQAVYPFDDPVALVCNDEGKLLGLPWNRLGEGLLVALLAPAVNVAILVALSRWLARRR